MAAATPSPAPSYPTSLPPEAIAYAQQFFDFARQGNTSAFVAPLNAGLPPNLTNQNGDSLLMLASYHGHAELVKLLLEKGADTERVNEKGQSILAGAVFKSHTEVIKLLLERGADVDNGTPSALEAVRLFKLEEWEKPFLEVRERKKGSSAAVNGA